MIVFTHHVVFQEGLVPLRLSQSQDGKAGKSGRYLQLMLPEFLHVLQIVTVYSFILLANGWIGDNEKWLRKMTKFENS